jgi:vitamin B12 transporter
MASGYQVTETLKLTALISTSFRVPNTGELFNTQYTIGNPNLKPEEHKGYELGLNYATPIGALRLVHFQSETSNAIAYKSGSPNYENIGLVENRGIEAAFTGVLHGWTYKFASVHQNPINAKTQARLARRARDYGSVDLSKQMMGIDWGAQLLASGNRVDSSNRLEAYTLVHLMASKKWTPDWTARVKIENAFNETYQLAYGYNTPPRGVFVSFQYQPK